MTNTATNLSKFLPLKQPQFDKIIAMSPLTESFIYNIPEAKEEFASFFFPYYQQYTSPMGRLPHKPVDQETETLAPFRAYNGPAWANWSEIWNQPPIELDIQDVSPPEFEFLFQFTLFRLSLQPSYLATTQEKFAIRQGTTFTYKGYDHEDVRFIVEWLQFIHEHNAYLKVVATTSDGKRIPYSDPDFPSFILIVPLCLAYIPTPPPGIKLYYAYPLDIDNEPDNVDNSQDIYTCWACENSF